MSFGGGGQADYRINYIISTRAEGAGAGPINEVSAATDKMTAANQKAVASSSQLKTAHERVIQSGLGVSKAAKGMAFGMIGMTTAGAEMVGMLSMWQATQDGVKEAQAAVNEALAEGGKESSEYKSAVMDLAKANRWAQMTFRNLMLSIFDMIPFIVLTINGILKLRTALAAAREAKAMEAALLGVGNASKVATTTTTTFTAAQAASNVQTVASTGAFKNQTFALGTATKATNAHTVATSRLATVAGTLLKVLLPIGIALGVGAGAAIAYKNNIGGLKEVFDSIGVAIGNAVPQLRDFLDRIKEVALAFPDLGKMWDAITGKSKGQDIAGAMGLSEKQLKLIEETDEKILDLKLEAIDFVDELSHMDKGERGDIFKMMGIKGGAKKRTNEALNDLEKMFDKIHGFSDSLKLIRFDTILGDAFDLPKSTIKKMAFTWEDRFNELGDELGIEGFNILADKMREVGKNPSADKFNQAIIDAFMNKEELVNMIGAFDPELAAAINTILDKEQQKIDQVLAKKAEQNAANLKGFVEASIKFDKTPGERSATGVSSVFGIPIDKFIEGGKSDAEKAGTELVKGIIEGFDDVDWTGVELVIRSNIMTPMIEGIKTVGENIPGLLRKFINENINKEVTTESTGGSVTGIDWEGLWNKILETGKAASGNSGDQLGVGKATWWKENVEPRIEQFWADLTNIENWNRYAEEKKSAFMEIPKLAWAHVENAFGIYVLEPLDWLGDQANKFVEQLTSVENWNKYFTEKQEQFNEIPKLFFDYIQNAFLDNTIFTEEVNKLKQNETIKLISGFLNDPIGTIMSLFEETKSRFEGTPAMEKIKSASESTISREDVLKILKIPEILKAMEEAYNYIKQQSETSLFITGLRALWSKLGDAKSTIEGMFNFAHGSTVDGKTVDGKTGTGITITISGIDISGLETSASEGARKIYEAFMTMVDNIAGLMNMLQDHWDGVVTQNMISVTNDLSVEFNKIFKQTVQNAAGNMNDLASHWSFVCNSLINNAESAADGINDALDSIEDEEVKIVYKISTQGSPPSSRFRAHGTEGEWVHKPTLFMAGEQGPELVSVTRAHSKPRVGSGGDGSGDIGDISSTFNGTINLKISGNEIVNPTKLSRKIKMTVGENRDKFG